MTGWRKSALLFLSLCLFLPSTLGMIIRNQFNAERGFLLSMLRLSFIFQIDSMPRNDPRAEFPHVTVSTPACFSRRNTWWCWCVNATHAYGRLIRKRSCESRCCSERQIRDFILPALISPGDPVRAAGSDPNAIDNGEAPGIVHRYSLMCCC